MRCKGVQQDENGIILNGDFLEKLDNILEENDIKKLDNGDEIEVTLNIVRGKEEDKVLE